MNRDTPAPLEGSSAIADVEASRALWNTRLRGSPDESAVGCAGFGRNYNHWLYRIRTHVFRRVARSLGTGLKELRILDAGSGTGFYIDQWHRLGAHHVEGLDFSTTGVAHLRRRFPGAQIHLADLADPELGLEKDAFDIISAFDVLFHIVDDERYGNALANLAGILRPDGILLLSENFSHHRRPRVSEYHYSRTLWDIERHLREAGLHIERRHPMFVLMNTPDDATHAALKYWWRAVSAIARRGERLGWLTGAGLYPMERILTTLLAEGPSTEIAVCRRQASPSAGSAP